MGEIVNLRRARKTRARADADKTAEANRIAFGRTKAEKTATRANREMENRRIDGHRIDSARDRQD